MKEGRIMNILLIDDEKYAVEGLISMLDWKRFEGTLTGTASNGKDALELIELSPPDVIISDIKMPVMDGLELAKEIYSRNWEIKLILLSAHGEFTYAQKAIQYGVTDYILKPVTRQKLKELEELLLHINQEKKFRKDTYLKSWSPSLKDEILTALRQCDLKFFDSYFSSEEYFGPMKSQEGNALGTQLLNYLYSYFEQLNILQPILDTSRSKTLSQFYDLPNPEEKINFIITRYSDVMTASSRQRHASTDTLIETAREYMQKHFDSPAFNISYLADSMNVSISYLSTIFKQSTCENLSTYLTNLRMEKAKELLSDVQYSISEVALKSGYEDSRYFAKYFKKQMNMKPSEYRNLCIQKSLNLQKTTDQAVEHGN